MAPDTSTVSVPVAGESAPASPPQTDPLQDLGGQLSALREFVSFYLVSKWDGAKATLREAALAAALTAIAIFTLCSLIFIGLVLLLGGIAQGLGEWFDHRLWLGCLSLGGAMLIAIGGCVYFGVRSVRRGFAERTRLRYEERKAQQIAQFGTSVDSAA